MNHLAFPAHVLRVTASGRPPRHPSHLALRASHPAAETRNSTIAAIPAQLMITLLLGSAHLPPPPELCLHNRIRGLPGNAESRPVSRVPSSPGVWPAPCQTRPPRHPRLSGRGAADHFDTSRTAAAARPRSRKTEYLPLDLDQLVACGRAQDDRHMRRRDAGPSGHSADRGCVRPPAGRRLADPQLGASSRPTPGARCVPSRGRAP